MTIRKNIWPETVNEAVNILMNELTEDEKADILKMGDEASVSLHWSLGMYVRNEFGLWEGNDALLRSCAMQNLSNEKEYGKILFFHPDDASDVIIDELVRRIKVV